MIKAAALFLITSLACYYTTTAQMVKPDHDTTYYRSFKGTIIVRAYLSRTYFQDKFEPPPELQKMNYHANKPLSFGVGVTYRSLSLNISHGLNFLKSDALKGKTSSTDLQLHLYKRKWVIDALAQFYKGFYMTPEGLAAPTGESYYKRSDMGVQLVGLSVNRVLNDQRFCYGAGLSQNAWQRKSAGSFLLGMEAFYIASNGDSSLVPHAVDSVYNQENIHKIHLFEIGPGVGYAYTLVFGYNFFLLGSLNANLNLRYSREIGNGIRSDKIGISPNFLFRLGAGYTSRWWSLNITWIGTTVNTEGKYSGYDYNITTGNYRLVYARRIAIGHQMRKILAPVPY
ncbi:MAG: DUF4421 family protein [Bacteroidetes bacterium]|nr:DUF4421 family protein [Bacteroidota bacterium]